MPSTYEPIATTTLGSNAASYTFSSIPSTYTDLVIVVSCRGTGNSVMRFQINGDTGSNYSDTQLYGNGTTAGSGRDSSVTYSYLGAFGMATATSTFDVSVINFMNYANTTTYKTVLSRNNEVSNGTNATVGLWRNTAAITSITLLKGTGDFTTGSTFTLYGIKAA
jgi:hypothetical protein